MRRSARLPVTAGFWRPAKKPERPEGWAGSFTPSARPNWVRGWPPYYHPCSEVGGDFLNVHAQGSSRYLILMGDVAGHDLRAGFISAYFQGMVRGLHERKVMAREILERFNAILIDEWATKDPANDLSHCEVLSSLAVCALLWDPLQRTVRILNCGLPPCIMVRSLSAISAVTHGSPPLGWFDVLDVEDLVVPLADLNWILPRHRWIIRFCRSDWD